MAITNFIPELWEAAIQLPFERALVFAQPSVVNRKYEGDIREMGDTVHVGTIADPTVNTYDKTTDLAVEDLTDSELTMVIDQGQYFNFRVNDVDKAQAAGDFQGPASFRAAFKMKDKLDNYVASLYTGVLAANNITLAGGVTTPVDVSAGDTAAGDAAYDMLVNLQIALDDADCPTDGRYAIVPPKVHGALLHNNLFVRVNESGSTEGLRNGTVGRAVGFDILKSNNCASPAAGQKIVMAGIPDALSVAEQITQTEALRAQNRFADLVRGLHVYGAKLFRPEGIAVATVAV